VVRGAPETAFARFLAKLYRKPSPVFLAAIYTFLSEVLHLFKACLFAFPINNAKKHPFGCFFVNRVVPIDKSSTILTIILAFILFKEEINVLRLVCVVLIAIGTYMMITKKEISQEEQNKARGSHGWLFYAVLSAVFASFTSILGKVGIEGINSNLGTAIRTIVVLIMAWIVVFATGKQHTIKHIEKKELGFICLSGLATGGSWLCYYKALQDGLASVVVPIDKLSIVVSIVFSYFVFKEKLTPKSFTGLVLIIAGTLIMLV